MKISLHVQLNTMQWAHFNEPAVIT